MLNLLAFLGGLSDEGQTRFSILQDLLVMTWGLNALNWTVLGRAMDWLGIRPRTQIGLLGILFSPLLHRDITHLFWNSIGFLVLGSMTLLQPETYFWVVTITATLTSGFGVWLFGRGRVYFLTDQHLHPVHLVHIGASGVIFGYLGFLLFRSFFDHNPLSLVLSLIVGVFYWHLLPGIFPKQISVSWESHLFGLVGGVLAAWFLPALTNG